MINNKILVIIDEMTLAFQIKRNLEDYNYNVVICNNDKDAIDLFNKENPIFVILELKLPHLTGNLICKQIREFSDTPILMLGSVTEEEKIIECFDHGIDDYVVKSTNPKIISAHVEAILRRIPKIKIDFKSYNYDDLIINYTNYEVIRRGITVGLTPIEFKILSLLSLNPSQVFTRDEIIQEISEYQYRSGSCRSVDSHIKNIRKKIEDSPPVYVKTIHGIGYKFIG